MTILRLLVLGALVFFAMPVALKFNNSLPACWFGLAGIVWFFALLMITRRIWAVLFIGWNEDVKIERWKRAGMLR